MARNRIVGIKEQPDGEENAKEKDHDILRETKPGRHV